ncbi:hypothetical protein GCM10022392_13740 [Mucilaginibacter panaciglaebae]|uniref:Uncharacterized protein n=1 Tax=Mucilaginibacter panaciglaebae TaxID=502331 RepID=A0ABP7WMX1_9SPHI
MNNKNFFLCDENTLMIVTDKGHLRTLVAPFTVRCIRATDILKENALVNVDAVKPHDEEIIMYLVLKKWMPYSYFQLIIK